MDIHFILGGRAVIPDNWRTFGPEVTRTRLDRLATPVGAYVRFRQRDAE